MNKKEAIKALREGKKLTHLYFAPEEWIIEDGLYYRFEDGYLCEPIMFWNDRKSEYWNADWRIK